MRFLEFLKNWSRATLGRNISPGTTVEKVDDATNLHHISRQEQDDRDRKRREHDGLPDFIGQEGLHMAANGRYGTIYYIRGHKVCELYWEISGVPQFDILIDIDSVDDWVLPERMPMSEPEKGMLREELMRWLAERNTRADLY